MDFFSNGNILLVGDGDFSFSVALSKYPQFQAGKTTTSNLETEASILIHTQAADNMAMLKEMGVSVFLEADARELHTHEAINKKLYDRIIFNFPLADRHNIKKNRALLADFFLSCRQILSPQGQVMVTLCKGQGGTPADQPIRSWHDSWQVVAMATNAGLLLQSVIPFDSSSFPEYHSVGFRFQDKSFNTSGALIHVFEMAEIIKDTDSGVRGSFQYNHETYSCSRYVAAKMKRNLLSEPNNPTAVLKAHLERSLTSTLRYLKQIESPSIILPGFRSLAHFVKEDCLDDNNSICGKTVSKDEDKMEKERKNREMLDKLKKSSFAHGVERNPAGEATTKDVSHTHQQFLPLDNESVYVLIKNSKNAVKHVFEVDDSQTKERECYEKPSEDDSKFDSGPHDITLDEHEPNAMSCFVDQSSRVFHHRVSLLENVPQLCDELIAKTSYCSLETNSEPAKSIKVNGSTASMRQKDSGEGNLSHYSDHCDKSASDTQNSPIVGEETEHCYQSLNSMRGILTSGQCMLPGPIGQYFLPVKQELMVVHQIHIPDRAHTNFADSCNMQSISSVDSPNVRRVCDNLLFLIVSALNNSKGQPPTCSFSLQPCNDTRLVVQGTDFSYITHNISLQNHHTEEHVPVGYVIFVKRGIHHFHITLFDITDFSCKLWNIQDKRLLWCTSDSFLSHFRTDRGDMYNIPPLMKPLCLYPMKFAHDISFWEKADTAFNVFSLYDVIRNVADDLVVQVSLIDSYVDADSQRQSRCYRLYFESRSHALPYLTSWKLQSRIRMEVSKTLGVTLR